MFGLNLVLFNVKSYDSNAVEIYKVLRTFLKINDDKTPQSIVTNELPETLTAVQLLK